MAEYRCGNTECNLPVEVPDDSQVKIEAGNEEVTHCSKCGYFTTYEHGVKKDIVPPRQSPIAGRFRPY